MSGICGFVGSADLSLVDAMLAAIDYRGDKTDVAQAPGVGLGYRWWGGRPGKSPAIYRNGPHLVACAGTLAPPVPSPAAALWERLGSAVSKRGLSPYPQGDCALFETGNGLPNLDGAFAGACWDGERRRLTLIRDPFGVRSLYDVDQAGVLYFA